MLLRSNKELTEKEFEVSYYMKRARVYLDTNNIPAAKETIKMALKKLHE
jgi:hypothetical protein